MCAGEKMGGAMGSPERMDGFLCAGRKHCVGVGRGISRRYIYPRTRVWKKKKEKRKRSMYVTKYGSKFIISEWVYEIHPAALTRVPITWCKSSLLIVHLRGG